jgi:oligoribonuclease NrnB/cAMP/cGMP phosphodiesterase (DHH superfamily)
MKSQIFNYIPNKQIKGDDNFDEWYSNYQKHLIEMYNITCNIINQKYGYKIINDNDDVKFNIFVNNIYDSSSRFIKEI